MLRYVVTRANALAALAAFAAPAALAQAPGLECGPRAQMIETLGERYQEQLIGGGLAGATRILEVWRAQDGSSWTILLTEAGGKSCIVAAGEDWVDFPAAMATMMDEYDS